MSLQWQQDFQRSGHINGVSPGTQVPHISETPRPYSGLTVRLSTAFSGASDQRCDAQKSIQYMHHHFADTLAVALGADACIVFEQTRSSHTDGSLVCDRLGVSARLRGCDEALPPLEMPDVKAEVKAIAAGDSTVAHYCTLNVEAETSTMAASYAHLLMLSFAVDRYRTWVIQFYRQDRGNPFSEHDEERLLPILPLVLDQAHLLTESRQHSAIDTLTQQIINQMSFGFFCVDEHCQILRSNDVGDAILTLADPLLEKQGHLSIRRRRENAVLHAHVARACEEPRLSIGSYAVIEALNSSSVHPYLIHVLPGGGLIGRSCAIILAFDPGRSLEKALMPVCGALGLSPSESRLAIALSDGASVKDAAKSIGIKEYTARTYLKQIFSKLRVQRQADLVRVLLKSAVPFSIHSKIT